MCSEFGSPMFFHDFPPSVLLYTPSPKAIWRPPTFSPLPTQTVLGLLGSMVTQPAAKVPCPSKIDCQVVPAFSVFQTPEEAVATYQRLSFSGCMAISEIRPDKNAGPTFLNLKASKETFSELVSVVFFFLLCACASSTDMNSIKKAKKGIKIFFMSWFFWFSLLGELLST